MEAHRTQGILLKRTRISNLLFENPDIYKGFIPELLLELSDKSLNNVTGKTVEAGEIFEAPLGTFENDEFTEIPSSNKLQIIPLTPFNREKTIVAIDVSSIRLGETEKGVLCSLRASLVWKESTDYSYLRFGPLIFYLTSEITKIFKIDYEKLPLILNPIFPINAQAMVRLRNLLEREIQKTACNIFEHANILIDGSLTTGTPDNPTTQLEQILKQARQNNNTVLGISKATKLFIRNKKITEILDNYQGPCLLDLDKEIKTQFQTFPIRLLGKIYVAKLLSNGFAFRLDIDEQISKNEQIKSINSLIGNDIIDQGYPETLRLAHILSSFTYNEILGIQSFLFQQYHIQIHHQTNIRRSLFGPFSTNKEVS